MSAWFDDNCLKVTFRYRYKNKANPTAHELEEWEETLEARYEQAVRDLEDEVGALTLEDRSRLVLLAEVGTQWDLATKRIWKAHEYVQNVWPTS